MRYNRPRRNRFRSNDNGFRRDGSQDSRIRGVNSVPKSFQRRSFSKNGANAEKLLEKYNDLAKEALSNGDRILSESYYQHADHFLRIIESRNSIRNNPKSNFNNSLMGENSDDKIVLENKKSSSPQEPRNSEEI